MLEQDLEELLRTHLATTGATTLRITSKTGNLQEHECRTKLGSRAVLIASFAQPEATGQQPGRLELLERAARALRACVRKHQGAGKLAWPETVFPHAETAAHDPKRLVAARIQQFLKALVDSSPLHQEVLMLRGRLVASATPLDEMEEAQLDLLVRQLDKANDAASGTAHSELVRPGIYAHSFWYGASLIGFCDGEYSVDFVRHRNKMVARELVHLLEMLEGGPDKPVKAAPP
tara:strand:- start:56106 stop:56804 length:699 start_codon:yes stop_codon:yes gene_type:complete